MSDEYLMSTADAAIAAEASKRVQAVIEAVWECVEWAVMESDRAIKYVQQV